MFANVAVIGVANPEWGQAVAAFFPQGEAEPAPRVSEVEVRLKTQLAARKVPRRWIAVPAAEWPRNAQGKVNRAALVERATRRG